jgi:RNA polymerase sigma factor (sigma-70 family)
VNALSDQQLLGEYAEGQSEAAFAELARRHVDLVYSAAMRMLCDAHLAEDVTQAVFLALARNARQLTARPILSGWLHRTALNLAVKAVRSEVRRRAREQKAAAMNQLLATEPDTTWEHIAPHLDAALGELSEPDRDALLLRYFERQSAREMAQTLGTSEEAAQKRVSRAVERLRECFAKRGVTVGASSLVGLVSAQAVQAAPVGLALTISTAAACAEPTAAIPHILQAVLSATTTRLTVAVLFAALSIPLALLWHQNASLRRELAALRASALEASHRPDPIPQSGEPEITDKDRQRLRKEHLELLSLRGRVNQLAQELRQRKAAQTPAEANPDPASERNAADSILFSAALTNRVGNGHTLVVGGWSGEGIRGYLLATPTIQQDDQTPDARTVTVQSQMIGAPESFWEQIGWGAARSDTRRSTLAGVLSPDQLDLLLKALEETKDVLVSNTSTATRRNGERIEIGWSRADDQGEGALLGVELYPWITPDGQFVDLAFTPSSISPNAPVHPFLRSTEQPTLP